ncbi:MAG: cell envelope integrity protein CreD [Pseudomonadota bacterium]
MKLKNSLPLKLAVIVGLVLVLLIPLTMIESVVNERSTNRRVVEHDIAATWTGRQVLIGPVINVPYQVRYQERVWKNERGAYEEIEKLRWQSISIMPDRLSITGKVPVEKRYRGIYGVPVFSAELSVEGTFPAAEVDKLRTTIKGFARFGTPEFAVGIGDARGIATIPTLDWNGDAVNFEPGSGKRDFGDGIHAPLSLANVSSATHFSLRLNLRGSKALQVVPLAGEAEVLLESPWPHPKFDGRFLPVERTVGAEGFLARWQLSSFSTNAPQLLKGCGAGQCEPLLSSGFGVQFLETVDLYQKVTRALKYGVLFIALTFTAFLLTEALSHRQLHAMHYLLVGCALSIFYLLLVSLSEHIGFAPAYFTAMLACIGLIGIYLSGVLESARLGTVYAVGLGSLYGTLFVVLRSEDFALLMGSTLLFATLAVFMLLTRRLQWRSEALADDTPPEAVHPQGGH